MTKDALDVPASAPAVKLEGKKIIIVDDNKINMEIMVNMLKEDGYSVETASGGKECLKKFSKSKEGTYGLIFMDLHMPKMDGFETSKQIRQMNRADALSVNIAALTVDDSEDILEKCAISGMNSYLLKPATKEAVRLLINGGNPLEPSFFEDD